MAKKNTFAHEYQKTKQKLEGIDDRFKDRVPSKRNRVFFAMAVIVVLALGFGFYKNAKADGSVWVLMHLGHVDNCASHVIELQERGILPDDGPVPLTICNNVEVNDGEIQKDNS